MMSILVRMMKFALLGILFVFPTIAFASSVNGTIDSVYKYAWSERLGWINFGTQEGNVHVLDDTLTGYAWNENTGWIDLDVSSSTHVTNNSEGSLSGYAWGEGIGYIDFTGVTIDADGYFHGYASSTLSGRISFNCLNDNTCASSDWKTKTDWRKVSIRNTPQTSSNTTGGGSYFVYGSTTAPASKKLLIQERSLLSVNTDKESYATLQHGSKNSDVTSLQKFLNANGYIVSSSGVGSIGNEGIYFGMKTEKALRVFQMRSQDTGVMSELGFVGQKTKEYILRAQAVSVVSNTALSQDSKKACSPYLLKHMKADRQNDPAEVRKLQRFLALYEGFSSLKETGTYMRETLDAVHSFQDKYTSDILGPWQTGTSTGYVYKTTRKKINELYCDYIQRL